MNHKIKALKNISWLLCEYGVRIVSGIVIASILARVLGVVGYGSFQYLLSLVVIFQSLSYIIPAEIMVPKLTNANVIERRDLMGNGFFIRLFFSVVAYALLLLFIYLGDNKKLFNLVLILGIIILFGESFSLITAFLQSQTIIKYRSVLYMIILVLKVIIFSLLYFNDIKDVYIYALIYAFESIFMAFGLIFAYKHINKELFFTFNLKKSIELLRQGIPFFIGIVFMCIFCRIDVIMMKHLSDGVSLGLYTSAIQLFGSLITISSIISVSFAPLFVYKFGNNYVVKRNILLLTFCMFFIAVVTAIVMYYLAPILIHIIFGVKFDRAIPVFKYLLFVLPLIFINDGLNIYIIKMQLGKMMIYKWMLILVGAILSYLYFIPKFGAIGAVIGLGIGYLLACLFGAYIIILRGKI